jgi:hypothetical protein
MPEVGRPVPTSLYRTLRACCTVLAARQQRWLCSPIPIAPMYLPGMSGSCRWPKATQRAGLSVCDQPQ